MRCEELRERLGEWVVGAMSEDEAATAKEHVSGCSACAAEADSLRELQGRLARLPMGIQRVARKERPRRLAAPALTLAAAALLVALGLYISHAPPTPPATPGNTNSGHEGGAAPGQDNRIPPPLAVGAGPRAAAAIEKTRAQKSVRTRFEAVIKAPNSDPLKLSGDSLQVAGGVLFIDYRASGGEIKRIVRVGDRVWVYHELAEEWIPAEQLGMNGAARGVQNPDEVLGVLARHLDGASLGAPAPVDGRPCDVVDIKLAGDDIEKIMKEQSQQGSFEWKDSTAQGRLSIGADGLVYHLSSSAELVSSDPNLKGQKVSYSADVSVAGYDDGCFMTFQVEDPRNKVKSDLPIDPEVFGAIETRPGVPPELLDEIRKARDAAVARYVAGLGSKDLSAREVSEAELRRWGKAAVPALKKALEDKDRAAAAKKLIEEIGG